MNTKPIWLVATVLTVSMCVAAPAQAGWPFKKKKDDASEQQAGAAGKQAGHPAWLNDQGEVIKSSDVEEGYGEKVKGINDWEGEVVGKPAPGSKFTQLKIGMPVRQVTDIVGQPTDQGVYATGKAWIPFYHGSGSTRQEYVYKGMGRLIFDSKGSFESGANLVWIIHNANESGYRE